MSARVELRVTKGVNQRVKEKANGRIIMKEKKTHKEGKTGGNDFKH